MAAILTNGVPHSTGYPTYILLSGLVQAIPVGTPYFRGVLLSSLPAALAGAVLVRWINQTQNNSFMAGLIAALAIGTSPLYWSQAVILEVHGLQSLFHVLMILWLAKILTPDTPPWMLFCLAAIAGLGMGNHLTLSLWLPAVIWAFLHSRKCLSGRVITGQVIFFIGGMVVYLALPLRAMAYPPVNWGNPQTWQGFWWLVGGEPYRGLLFSLSFPQIVERFIAWGVTLRQQFSFLGILLGIWGLIEGRFSTQVKWCTVWGFGIFSLFALFYAPEDSQVYLLPSFIIFAVWIGSGVAELARKVWHGKPVGSILAAGIVVYMLVGIPQTYQAVDPRSDLRASTYAEAVLQQAPADAILLTYSDADTFPLWGYHFGLKQRNDLIIVVVPLLRYSWYQETLQHTYPALNLPSSGDLADRGEMSIPSANLARPICRIIWLSEEKTQARLACE